MVSQIGAGIGSFRRTAGYCGLPTNPSRIHLDLLGHTPLGDFNSEIVLPQRHGHV